MDSGTASHPPCPMCEPSILPEGYEPLPLGRDGVIVRPDGSRALLRGTGKCYLNGVDVTNATKDVDPERGVIVAYHRVLGPAFVPRSEYERGVRSKSKPAQMTRHMCNREGLDKFDPRLTPAGVAHACQMVLTGDVFVLDPATGKAPVFADLEDVPSAS